MTSQTLAQARPGRATQCPHCAEGLGLGRAHVCPAGCCYVPADGDPATVTCPYCGATFMTVNGHVCPVLVRMTLPQQ